MTKLFQFVPSRGGQPDTPGTSLFPSVVSIRALTRRATCIHYYYVIQSSVSIRALTRRATEKELQNHFFEEVSIRALTRRATSAFLF